MCMNNKGFLNIALSIAAVIIIVAGSYLFGTRQVERKFESMFGATIATTSLSDTINTFRTNVNTSLTNLNNTLTFTTSSDTNIHLRITSSSGSLFTPVWIGTLADGRITSAATWNAKQGALSFPLAEASSTVTRDYNFTYLNSTTSLNFTHKYFFTAKTIKNFSCDTQGGSSVTLSASESATSSELGVDVFTGGGITCTGAGITTTTFANATIGASQFLIFSATSTNATTSLNVSFIVEDSN